MLYNQNLHLLHSVSKIVYYKLPYLFDLFKNLSPIFNYHSDHKYEIKLFVV